MTVQTVVSDQVSSLVFTKFVEGRVRAFGESFNDEEEIQEHLSEAWNNHEVVEGVHMTRSDSETIIMTQLV
jgi:hypothetical protein